MQTNDVNRLLSVLQGIADSGRRIADALERIAPPPAEAKEEGKAEGTCGGVRLPGREELDEIFKRG